MAEQQVHQLQAAHNEALARDLATRPPFHDWALTAAFYAAVHLFEAWLSTRPEQHSEKSLPVHDGEARLTMHAWRTEIIKSRCSADTWIAFRKLKETSETARYLTAHTADGASIGRPASEYFTATDVERIIDGCLRRLKWDWRTVN